MRRLVALLLVLAALVACSGDDDDDAPDDGDSAPMTGTTVVPDPGGRLVVGVEDDIGPLDPAAGVFSYSELSAALGVFDPLLAVRKDGEVVPYLAESFQGSEDDTTWTIGLRDGVTFSDGTPLDAAAVVAMLDRLVTSPAVQQVMRPLRGFTVVDAATVEITSEPWPGLPSLLAGQLGLVPSPSMTDGRRPIGTGPFVVDAIVEGEPVVLRRSASYWRADDDLPFLDELELRAVPDVDLRVAQVAGGELDAIHVSGASPLEDITGVAITGMGDSRRSVVALTLDPDLACVVTVADQCDAGDVTVRTDQPDEVVAPVVDRWEDAGLDVRVERVDGAAVASDRLVGSYEVLLTVDDGLLDIGRLDGAPVERGVVATIPWSYGSRDVGGLRGLLPLPEGNGQLVTAPGLFLPAALHRTR